MKKMLLAAALLALPVSLLRAQEGALGELGAAVSRAAADTLIVPEVGRPVPMAAPTAQTAGQVPEKYAYVDPERQVPENLLAAALAYYSANLKKIKNPAYLSVVDFSKYSGKARFFIINMKSGAVKAIHVAHGSGSDPEDTGFATIFGNQPNSNMSSLGFYETAEIYTGSFGRSMRLNGLSPTNSNVRARNVIIHGFAPVDETGDKVGESWGCLAVSPSLIDEVISELRNGTIIYAGLSGVN